MFCTRLCLKRAAIIGLIAVLPAAAWQTDPQDGRRAFGSAQPVVSSPPGDIALSNDFYQYDDGTAEGSIGLVAGGETAWMHVFETLVGGEVITAVSTAIGAPIGDTSILIGDTIQVYVWSNPGGGNPSDGTLLATGSGVVTNTDDDVFMKITLDNPALVSGFFTIGASIVHPPGFFPAPLDTSQPSNGRAWIAGDTDGTFDPNNIGGGAGVFDVDDIGAPGVFLLRANAESFGLCGDANCDGLFNNFDIDPFFLALFDPAEWQAQFPGCNILNLDVNQDGRLNSFDIDFFFQFLVAGGCP